MNTVPANPRALGLPFDEWRDGQREVVQALADWYINGREKFMFLEAPTGIGKSLIAGALIAYLVHEDVAVRGLISTVSKSLQSQYADGTLPMAQLAWGKGNHECLVLPPGHDPGDSPCTYGYTCSVRHECGYYVERDAAAVAPMAVLNTAFLLTCLHYVKTGEELARYIPVDEYFSGTQNLFDGASLYIHDEAHLLEGAIRNSVEMKLHHSFFNDIGFSMPLVADYREWGDWCESVLPTLQGMRKRYQLEAKAAASRGEVPRGMELDKRAVGYAGSVSRLLGTLLPLHPNIDLSMNQYVLVRPIWGAPFAEHALFRGAKKHLLMSATIIHPNYMAQTLGIKAEDFRYVSLPSPFPAMSRRVIDVARVKVNYKTTPGQFQVVIDQMDEIIASRPGDKGIIHAVSYARAQQILKQSANRHRMITHTSGKGQKELAIKQFAAAGPGAILVSPSVGVGEDFGKDDGCRMQFFVKFPFPSLGDPIVQARAQEVPDSPWYEADMAFVQAVGRGMRTPTDYCDSYVLDAGARWRFGNLPEWFTSSIIRRA